MLWFCVTSFHLETNCLLPVLPPDKGGRLGGVIGGSIFPHKRIHKSTWRSTDHVTEDQIDRICISHKFRRSWRDVRVMRGADVSSDHHPLPTALRFRLKRVTNIKNTRTKYHVGLLRNKDTQAAFNISLSNRYQLLQDLIDPETDIKTHWEHSKKIWHDTCEECLGRKKTQHKDWISADTIRKLEARKAKNTALNTIRTRAARTRAQAEYAAADREVKKDKRDYIDDLASQAETAAWQGNRKDLYLMAKKLLGKFQQTDKPVRDENRNPLTTREDQLKRWAEHVRELLNRPAPHHQTSRTQRKNYPSVVTSPPWLRSERPSTHSRTGRQQGRTRYEQKPSKQTWKQWSTCCTASSARSGKKRRYQPSGRKVSTSSCRRMWTSETAATIKGSCSCQSQARFSTGFYWRG